jgi:uncharacterized protein YbaR (Trm112 family)
MTLLGSGTSHQEDTRTYTEDGDHERYAHYAPADEVTYALIEGVPIMALCGKIWIPNRDPKKFPVCPTCKEIYSGMQE